MSRHRRPTGALIQDLKDRDMLKDTLVIWGGRIWTYPIWPVSIRGSKETYRAGSLRPRLQLDHGGRRSETGKHLRGER